MGQMGYTMRVQSRVEGNEGYKEHSSTLVTKDNTKVMREGARLRFATLDSATRNRRARLPKHITSRKPVPHKRKPLNSESKTAQRASRVSNSQLHQNSCHRCQQRLWCPTVMDLIAQEQGWLSWDAKLAAEGLPR